MNTIAGVTAEALSLPGEALGADAQGRPVLLGCACQSCGNKLFPAAPVCPACLSEEMVREAMPRTGVLYSFTTAHVGPKNWNKPYLLGYVDLTNGVRVFTHLRGALTIGQSLELATAQVGQEENGRPIRTFVFQPAGS